MIGEVCAAARNYFVYNSADIHYQHYTVNNGEIEPLAFIKDGQYYRIVGSTFNDGVYKHGTDDMALTDEEFDGSVWAMHVPPAFVELCDEIEAWREKHKSVLDSPYQSESFGGYSYSKSSGRYGGTVTWEDQFRSRINQYRRLCVL